MSWQSQPLELLSALLLRPLMPAAAAWLILRVFRVRHPASRHAVWSAVLAGMLLLPGAVLLAPRWELPLLPPRRVAVIQAAARAHAAADYAISGFATGAIPAPAAAPEMVPAKASEWPAPGTALLWCYLAGVLGMAGYRVAGWMMLSRILSRSKATRFPRLRESSDVLVPVTVGVLRPSVILPAGWPDWDMATKRAVVAHEFAHIRRGDTRTSFLSRLAKCVYWFHPLAWWVSRQIADMAELSCDAVVLRKSGDPGGYARILLGFAESASSAGYRASLPGVAIASGPGLGNRIDQVFELAGGNLRRLSRPKIVLALAGFPVICIAATVGLTEQSAHGTQPASLVAQSVPPAAVGTKPPQPPPAPRPKFDVVSVRRCMPGGLPGPASGEGGGRGTGPRYSPGRLRMQCMTVGAMMEMAYLGWFGEGDGLLNYTPSMGDDKWLRKAPGWVNSELYTVEGKTDDPAAKASGGSGPRAADKVLERMLQVALEDRFQLKLHTETEEVPMYNLTVARGGLRLKPMAPGGCIAPDPALGRVSPTGVFMTGEWSLGDKTPPCMIVLHVSGPDWALDAAGQKPGNLVGMLSKALDRHVFDRTGIGDLYTFHLRFAHDGSAPGDLPQAAMERMFPPSDVPADPSVFTALERVGLKLEPTRGPQGHYVIDHIERSSEN